MRRPLLAGIICIIILALLAGGCAKRGHIITVGPTGLDPDAKPPTIRDGQKDASPQAWVEQDESAEEIMERISRTALDEFDCDAETAKLEEQLAFAREQNSKVEKEFFDVLTELSAAQTSIAHSNNSETQARYSRAQAAYDQMDERAKESRERVKGLKLAIQFARDRCSEPIRDVITPEEAPSPDPVGQEEVPCANVDAVLDDLEGERQDLFDLEQDRLDELEERYELDDDLDAAEASGDGTADIQSDIDEKDEEISGLADEIADLRDDIDELRRNLRQKKDACTLPRNIMRICMLARETIEGTISGLDEDIQEIEGEIDDMRQDRRRAIEDGDMNAKSEAEGDLGRKRSDLREKQEDLFEEKDGLFAHRVMC